MDQGRIGAARIAILREYEVEIAVAVDVPEHYVLSQRPRRRRHVGCGHIQKRAAAVVEHQAILPIYRFGDVEIAVAIDIPEGYRIAPTSAGRHLGRSHVGEPAMAIVQVERRSPDLSTHHVQVAVRVNVSHCHRKRAGGIHGELRCQFRESLLGRHADREHGEHGCGQDVVVVSGLVTVSPGGLDRGHGWVLVKEG